MSDHEIEPAALQAAYSDLKIIKTRGAFQIIFEMPLSGFNHAMAVLGGAPRPDQEVWVAIARLNPEQPTPLIPAVQAKPIPSPAPALENAVPKEKRSWFDMPALNRACMRCSDHRFWKWLHEIGRVPEPGETQTLEYVRRISGGSRSNLGKNGFEKETEAWDIVDRAFAKHLEQQRIDSMR